MMNQKMKTLKFKLLLPGAFRLLSVKQGKPGSLKAY